MHFQRQIEIYSTQFVIGGKKECGNGETLQETAGEQQWIFKIYGSLSILTLLGMLNTQRVQDQVGGMTQIC